MLSNKGDGAVKRFIIFVCGLLLVIALAIAAVPFFLTADFVGDQLKTAVAKNTGRTLTINGALRFKFWPELMVEANDVSLSNPPNMFKGQFAAIKTLRIKVAALPLLSKQVDIREMTLLQPRLSLVVDGKGRENWSFTKTGSEKSAPAAPAENNAGDNNSGGSMPVELDGVKLAPIVIRDGDVRFLDERAGSTFAARQVNLTIKIGGLSGPVDLRGNLV
ncbi:MAG TPA: AsmA family protein, partial [Rhizobiales bacterium]|nr:AsmA family protein [Hyphomicrobiales bacterium]